MAWAGFWTTHKLAGELVGCGHTHKRAPGQHGRTGGRPRPSWMAGKVGRLKRTERDVVLLEDAGRVRLGHRRHDGRVGLAGEAVGGGVDAGELDADGCGQTSRGQRSALRGSGGRAQGESASDLRTEKSDLTLASVIECRTTDLRSPDCSAAPERSTNFLCLFCARRTGGERLARVAMGEASRTTAWRALQHRAERLRRRRPRAFGLAEAQLAERRADVRHERAAERVIWVVGRERVGIAEGGVGRLRGGDRGGDVVARNGKKRWGDLHSSHLGGRGHASGVGADGHVSFRRSRNSVSD